MSDYSDTSSSPEPAAITRLPSALEAILLELGPITSVSYDPFKCEPPQPAKALLPASFPPKPHPFDYFSLFFTPDLFKTITKNTNTYARIYRIRVLQENTREWSNLLLEELYIFIGVVLYMGVYYKPQIELYWNSDFNKGPLHTITAYIGLY